MSSPVEKMLAAPALAALAATAIAGERIGYGYDARGRLVRVVRSDSVNDAVAASYSSDKGDNRMSVNLVFPNATPR